VETAKYKNIDIIGHILDIKRKLTYIKLILEGYGWLSVRMLEVVGSPDSGISPCFVHK
jgi:hypothetical protein